MGLDVVEIVMRTEEVFGITIPDGEAEAAVTVGKLYEVACLHLNLPPDPTRPIGTGSARTLNAATSFVPRMGRQKQWTREDVWATLVALVADQLGVREDEVSYDAHWGEDLRAD